MCSPFQAVRGFHRASNPLLIGVTAAVGLVAFPVLQPGWVFCSMTNAIPSAAVSLND
jgi:hypothetical protein